jgi:hypothetical protein
VVEDASSIGQRPWGFVGSYSFMKASSDLCKLRREWPPFL